MLPTLRCGFFFNKSISTFWGGFSVLFERVGFKISYTKFRGDAPAFGYCLHLPLINGNLCASKIIERNNKNIQALPEQVDYPVSRFISLKLNLLQLNLTGWQNAVCFSLHSYYCISKVSL